MDQFFFTIIVDLVGSVVFTLVSSFWLVIILDVLPVPKSQLASLSELS